MLPAKPDLNEKSFHRPVRRGPTITDEKSPNEFTYSPAAFVRVRDRKEIERVRRIKREDITKHWNPDFRISVHPAADFEFKWIADLFYRIQTAMEAGRTLVMIIPNPEFDGRFRLGAPFAKARTFRSAAVAITKNCARRNLG